MSERDKSRKKYYIVQSIIDIEYYRMRAICINKPNGQMLYFFVVAVVIATDVLLLLWFCVYKITHRKCANQA